MIRLREQKAGHRPQLQRSDLADQRSEIRPLSLSICTPAISVSLLTGGSDKPYVLGFVPALTSKGISFDVIGGDDLHVPELLNNPLGNFLNLRGDQGEHASFGTKVLRILVYYCRLVRYA